MPDRYTGSTGQAEKQGIHSYVSCPAHAGLHPWDLPIKDFVGYAIEWSQEKNQESDENWKSPVFEFTRLIRGKYPEGTHVDKVLADISRFVDWTELENDYELDAETAFRNIWAKIKFRPDEDPLEQALRKADAHPITPPPEKKFSKKFNRFFAFCGWLQVTMGDRPIYLPCIKIAALLKVRPNTVSDWRQVAIREGYLQVVKEHLFTKQTRLATEMRFNEHYAAQFREILAKRVAA